MRRAKSGPEGVRKEGAGDESEKGGSWITARWAHVSIGLATTDPQKTGCLRRNRLCVGKGNDGYWQVPSRASHERAERGHGLGPADPDQLVRRLGLFYRARVS